MSINKLQYYVGRNPTRVRDASKPRVKGHKTKWNFIATVKTLSTTSNEDRQQGTSNPMA